MFWGMLTRSREVIPDRVPGRHGAPYMCAGRRVKGTPLTRTEPPRRIWLVEKPLLSSTIRVGGCLSVAAKRRPH
jgi:hypothetical protein